MTKKLKTNVVKQYLLYFGVCLASCSEGGGNIAE